MKGIETIQVSAVSFIGIAITLFLNGIYNKDLNTDQIQNNLIGFSVFTVLSFILFGVHWIIRKRLVKKEKDEECLIQSIGA